MDLIDQLHNLGERVKKIKSAIGTEEATKNALIMPFIQALGYDVFNPLEVTPELTADIGIKKGEKVDYAILKEGVPVILIECKSINDNLEKHGSQLARYFHVTHARFSILTNGVHYQFFSDLDEPNKMDQIPFLEFRIDDLSEFVVNELKKFNKSNFDIDNILSTANDLKYSRAFKDFILGELKNPSEDFTRYISGKVYTGRLTAKIIDQLAPVLKRSMTQMIGELINDRLKSALTNSDQLSIAPAEPEQRIEAEESTTPTNNSLIVTTDEELEGFHIVRAILAKVIDVKRIYHRDTQSYFGILFDNNNRKPICRLHFNGKTKTIGLLDAEKNETKHVLHQLSDIYHYADDLRAHVQTYLSEEQTVTEEVTPAKTPLLTV